MKFYLVQRQKQLPRLRVQEFDVAIIGGGLVGAVFARAIADLNMQVVLIDQVPIEHLYHKSQDNRGLALGYSTIVALQSLGVSDCFKAHAHMIDQVHVSQQNSFGVTKLSAQAAQIPHLGAVVSASKLAHALIENLDSISNLVTMRPIALRSARFLSAELGWELQTAEKSIRAKFVVAADGTNSHMRKIAGLNLYTKDFAQTALVCNVSINVPHANIAYERFADIGVLALLPFGKQQMKCILTVDNTKLAALHNLADKEFLQLLQHSIGYRAGHFTQVTERKTFPILTAWIERIYDHNIFFIGNAANTLHPVAAQGFNLGVRDALCLAYILRRANKSTQCSIDDLGKNYITARMADQKHIREFSNNLVEIFANSTWPVQSGRKLGLMLTEFIPALKSKIVRQGLGIWM